jgi:hypothetical protein
LPRLCSGYSANDAEAHHGRVDIRADFTGDARAGIGGAGIGLLVTPGFLVLDTNTPLFAGLEK